MQQHCRRNFTVGLAVVALGIAATTAQADLFTGNPATDGWTYLGKSTDPGVFARVNTTAANDGILLGYDLYSAAFTVTADSKLITKGGIQAGNTVYGIGAVINDDYDYQKVLVKLDDGFGNFTPSTYVPNYPGDNGQKGDGLASSGSNMGDKGVLYYWSDYDGDGTDDWPTTGAPSVLSASDANWSINDATQESAFNNKGIMFMGQTDANDHLKSFQFFFSNDPMGSGWTDLPSNAEFVLSVDTGPYYTDSIGSISALNPAAVPEPSSLILLTLSSGGLMLLRRRKRNRDRESCEESSSEKAV